MYKSFRVRNFRCFREINISDLERVNLIAGMNNSGKTALLEALFLYCGAYIPELALRLNAFRGIESVKVEFMRWAETLWDSIFTEFDTSKILELVGENELTGCRVLRLKVIRQPDELAKIGQFIQYGREKRESLPLSSEAGKGQELEHVSTSLSLETAQVLELEYEEAKRHGRYYMIVDPKGIRTEPIPPSPPFPAFFQGARIRISFLEEAERFRKLQVWGEEDVLLQVLKLIEPRLTRLTMVLTGGQPMFQGDIGMGRLIPLPIMGEGMVRLASLVLLISNAPKGVVLVDEIENGIHHSILPKVWQAIGQVARRFNTQVFATTHSLECIIAAHRSFTESGIYDFRVYRLDQAKGIPRAVTYDQEALEAAIETGMEVR